MAKKKKEHGGSESFYSFSRDYPGGSSHYTRQGKRMRKERTFRITVITLIFCVLFVSAYFITTLMMDISNRPIAEPVYPDQETQMPTESQSDQPVTEAPKAERVDMRAVWVNFSVLSGEEKTQSFINTITQKNINCVVIDFKREDGSLIYSSTATNADKIESNKKTVDKLGERLEQFRQANIKIIARVCCFKDPLAPEAMREAAVHYKNTPTLWYNNYIDKGGEPWLNPYSREAQQYLISIITEIKNMSVDAIMLDYVQFPSGYALDLATFDGESSGESRNTTLLKFIDLVKATIGRQSTLIVSMTGDGALNGSSQFYDGSLMDSDAGIVAPDLRFSKLSAIKIGEEEFKPPSGRPVEFITLAGEQLERRVTIGGRTTEVMPWIEASAKTKQTLEEQLEALKTAGITSYIIYNSASDYS